MESSRAGGECNAQEHAGMADSIRSFLRIIIKLAMKEVASLEQTLFLANQERRVWNYPK